MAQPTVTIYTTPSCHFCHAAKEFFTAHNVQFTEYDVASDVARRQEMIQRSGQMGVPVITIGDELVIGFNEPKLKSLLGL